MYGGLFWNCEVWFRGGSLQYVLYGESVSLMAKEALAMLLTVLLSIFAL